MQNEGFAVLDAKAIEGVVDGGGVFAVEGGFFGVEEAVESGLFGFVSLVVAADAVDGDAVGDGVEPGLEGAGIFQLSNAADDLEPDLLQDIERGVGVSGEAGGVIEQRPFHGRDEVSECARFAGLAAKGEPLELEPFGSFVGHLSNMSKMGGGWFNDLKIFMAQPPGVGWDLIVPISGVPRLGRPGGRWGPHFLSEVRGEKVWGTRRMDNRRFLDFALWASLEMTLLWDRRIGPPLMRKNRA